MIPETIFQHILKTLNLLLFRPVLVLCTDCAQQQPFSKHNVESCNFQVHLLISILFPQPIDIIYWVNIALVTPNI